MEEIVLFDGENLVEEKIKKWVIKKGYGESFEKISNDNLMLALDKYKEPELPLNLPSYYTAATTGNTLTITQPETIMIDADNVSIGSLSLIDKGETKLHFVARTDKKEVYGTARLQLQIIFEDFKLKYKPKINIEEELERTLSPLEILVNRIN